MTSWRINPSWAFFFQNVVKTVQQYPSIWVAASDPRLFLVKYKFIIEILRLIMAQFDSGMCESWLGEGKIVITIQKSGFLNNLNCPFFWFTYMVWHQAVLSSIPYLSTFPCSTDSSAHVGFEKQFLIAFFVVLT